MEHSESKFTVAGMQLPDLNLRLLAMFDAVWRARSISGAAHDLGMSQPGVSIGLAKLRRHFGDPLFVRSPAGMDPTAHAQAIAPLVRQALSLIGDAARYKAQFRPASTERAFRICMSDVTQVLVMPRLLARFARDAPHASLEIVRPSADTPRRLASGEVDLAIGLLRGLSADYREQMLVRRSFACIASRAHPRVGATLSLEEFEREPQIVVEAGGTGLKQAEELLARRKRPRQVRARIPDFAGLLALVAESDLIATVPREVGERMALQGAIKVLDHPVRIPSYAARQYWHQRYHRDPGNVWLREVLREIMAAGK